MNTDKFNYFPAETADPVGKYTQPKEFDATEAKANNGYSQVAANTQTVPVRGCGACTKGNKFIGSIIK
jgi:hypothetical protein